MLSGSTSLRREALWVGELLEQLTKGQKVKTQVKEPKMLPLVSIGQSKKPQSREKSVTGNLPLEET